MREINCYKCGSTNSRCWDERNEWFECKCGDDCYDEDAYISNGKRVVLVQLPVGYFVCRDCGASWRETDETDECKHIGNDREAGFDNY